MRHRTLKITWITAALLCAMLVPSCKGAGPQGVLEYGDTATYQVPYPEAADIGFRYDSGTRTFAVTDSRSGKVWNSGLTDEYYGQTVVNKLLQKSKMQLFTMTYCDEDGFVTAIKNTDDGVQMALSSGDDGVSLAFSFDGIGIGFSIGFTVIGNTLQVTVPGDSIRESVNRIVSIEMLPFLGASINSEDGYIFYPDGSGTLYDFKEEKTGIRYPYKEKIFGDAVSDLQEYIDDSATGVKWIMLPVFGVKQGASAFIGTVTRGEADTTLCFAPSGYIFNASRVYPIFNYRYSYTATAVTDEEVVIFEKGRYTGDFQMQYTFLDGESADYSGMARAYRQYLLANRMLNQSAYRTNVALDLLVSIRKGMLLWDEKVVLSDFSSGTDILNGLHDAGLSGIGLSLLGWQSDGYNTYPAHFPVSRAAGGAYNLHKLISASTETGSMLMLKDNFFEADKSQKGYSSRNDTVFNIGNEIITNTDKNKFLLDYRKALSFFEDKWAGYAGKFNLEGISIDVLGRFLYGNSMKDHPLRFSDAVVVGKEFARQAADDFEVVSISGGNEYVLQYADCLSAIPESSSGDFAFDRDIPFFQMVVHGYLPYMPEIPGNISDDFQKTVLRWAEYGYVPYFTLSDADPSVLKDTYSDGVFVSRFDEWKDRVLDTSLQFSQDFASLADVPITSREEAADGIIVVTYENGIEVVVNYTDFDTSYEGHDISAMSYTVVDSMNEKG
ncbi:MAG: DUF5696 domain-containing protein [Saccharofermentanales bacterium]